MNPLPIPDYERDASDPDWLAYAAQFHGHLGPWAAAGLRAGACARRAVEAKGYFDIEIVVEGPLVKPPPSCMIDGLQVSTGATLGKRNLTWIEAEQLVVRAKNTRTGKVAEVRPTATLLEMLGMLESSSKNADAAATDANGQDPRDANDQPPGHNPVEALARRVACMTEGDLFRVSCV